ncbi:MAG: thymidine phosphorylase, partial [Chloroflexota bacterium]
ITVAPLVAACGVPVGKMSGRGLGHTGGTLDKLESIPGFTADLTTERFKRQLAEVGLVLAGQTHDLAPADGRLYALRDVTATVASLPLIASSIMSKKIAAGADAIVLDVKVGRGAFMQTEADAVALAQTMVAIGQGVGRRVSAVIADMNQPLGRTVGNALEVMEAIAALKPERNKGKLGEIRGNDFVDHCMIVASEMLCLVGRARDEQEARQILSEAIESGRALQKFREWIAAQGGDARVADEHPERDEHPEPVEGSLLPRATHIEDVAAPRDGYIVALDALAVGQSAMRLGAGRMKKGDPIDLAVGVVLRKKIGDRVARGDPLFTIHANDGQKLRAERDAMLGAYQWADEAIAPPQHIHRIIR